MLVINNQKCTLHIGGILLMPGSNIVDEARIDRSHPIIASLEKGGKLVFESEITPGVAAMAISQACTSDTVDQIEKATKKEDDSVKRAAASRKKEIADFDAEWEKARKKQKQKETDEEATKL